MYKHKIYPFQRKKNELVLGRHRQENFEFEAGQGYIDRLYLKGGAKKNEGKKGKEKEMKRKGKERKRRGKHCPEDIVSL